MTMTLFLQLLRREWIITLRQLSDCLNPLLFFLIVAVLFSMSVNPTTKLLQTIGPGVIWVAALLAMLLAQSHLFESDFKNGVCAQWCLQTIPLTWIIFSKVVAQWLLICGPLIVISPLLAISLHLSLLQIEMLMLGLLLGTPSIFLLGAAANALTLGLRGGGILLAILILPLSVPILIFGVGTVMSVPYGLPVLGLFLLLFSILVLAVTLLPLITAAAIRLSVQAA